MGMQPILPITVPVKKNKGAAHQYYGDGDEVIWCEQTFSGCFWLFGPKFWEVARTYKWSLHSKMNEASVVGTLKPY